jgi:signal transduction histidine kinase
MIDRTSLQFALAWRLTLLLFVVSIAAIAGLRWYVCQASAGYQTDVAHAVLLEFFANIVWAIPVVGALTLAMAIWAIRSSLAPLGVLSEQLCRMTPGNRPANLSRRALPGEIVPLVAAVDDALSRLHAAYEAQRHFAANAAHELRTPLAILRSGLERMPEDEMTCSLREDAMRLSRIVAQLLELARIESGPVTISGSVDLTRLVTDVAAAAGPLAYERNVNLTLQSQASVCNARGTTGLVEPIVRNLLENAILYTTPGTHVSLTLSASGMLTIDDRGPGIPAEERSRIFDRFWRGSQARANGCGLGLAIVKEVIDRIGATIDVKERAHGGTRFRVQFAT